MSVLRFSCSDQGEFIILFLMAAKFALLKCQLFYQVVEEEEILKFTLQSII